MVTPTSLTFRASGAASTTPNITVDSPPNPGTVLLLDHGPHSPQIPGLRADLACEMAFRYLDQPVDHAPAQVVSSDHVDADTLVSVLALTDPEMAKANRGRLIELARADDFAVYRDRQVARAAMALRTFIDPHRSPIAEELHDLSPLDLIEVTVARALPLLVDLLTDIDRFQRLWEGEDRRLATCLQAFEDGLADTIEHPVDKLSIIRLLPGIVDLIGSHDPHRALHPLALNQMSRGSRQLVSFGQHYHYIDRAESWFQYRAKQVPARINLGDLAEDLNFLEGGPVWVATPPSDPVAWLTTSTESILDISTVTTLLIRQLRTSPPAWDPFAVDPDRVSSGTIGANR